MVAAGALTGPAAAAARQPSSPAAVVRQAEGPAAAVPDDVTLITGDRVRLAGGPGGLWSARIDPRYAQPGVSYYERTVSFPGHRGDVLVIPSDVSSLISSGSLDENLFDVSQLARDADSDAARGTLPVTVTYRHGTAPTRLPGTRGVSGVAGGGTRMTLAVPKARARQFWAMLTRPAASRGQLALAPGVARVQLAGAAALGSAAAAPAATHATGDVTITLKAIGRDGKAVPASQLTTWSNAVNLATGKTARFSASSTGAVTARVAPGNYDLTTNMFTAAGARPATVTLADDPHLSARHNVTVMFDARKAALLSAKVDRPVGDANVFASLLEKVHGRTLTFEAVSFFNSFQVYALPTPRVTGRPYRFLGQVTLDNGTPDPQKVGNATLTYSLMFPSAARIPGKLSFRVHDAALARVRETFREQGKRSTFVDLQHIPLALEQAGLSPAASSSFPRPARSPSS